MKRAIALPIVSIFALGALTAGPAVADDSTTPTDPCAKQQTQVDRASAKYAALQSKYAEHPSKKNKKAKKAQAQRVAHAQARLDDCQAESAAS
jgi:hypothetical protein